MTHDSSDNCGDPPSDFGTGVAGKCIRCDKAIAVDEHGCLDDAMSGPISGGYGSRNDLCQFSAFICDDCAYKAGVKMFLYDGTEYKQYSREEYDAACKKSLEQWA